MTTLDPRASGNHQIALSMRAHDRVGSRRTDQAWLDEVWADPTTQVLPLSRGRFPTSLDRSSAAWRTPDEAPAGQRVFLGSDDGVARFAVLLDHPPDGEEWHAFRTVGGNLSEAEAGFVVHALALAEWHAAHRFCPRCGGGLAVAAAGHVLTCTDCGRQHFPRTDPAVIMLVTDGERALLGRQPSWPEGRYSTLAGFVDPGESLEQAVVREVAEEVGVQVTDVTYFGNQPWPFPASLMVGFFARALTTEISVDDEEISDARWYTREQVRDEVEAGSLVLPGGISISHSLVEAWYGGPLPGHW